MDKSRNPTDAQYESLKQFKRNIADILTPNDTDEYLIKWLRNKNFNVRKAEEMFREFESFRKFYALDTICQSYTIPEVAQKYEYTAFIGYAKDGSLIRYNPVGRGDHSGLISSMSAYQLGLYATHIMEQDLERQRKRFKMTGENVTEITYIFDLAEIALQDIIHKCVYEMGLDLGHLVQECYPEIWGNIFFINVPAYFDTLFNMFKHIMKMSVIERMHVVSKDSTAEVLLQYIDEDVLPAFLGGKKVDSHGDPMCREFIPLGGKIPEKYYLKNQSPLLLTDPGVTAIWIRARSVFNHPVIVRKPNTTIRVEIRTESGSIHMSIYYKKFGPDPSVIELPATDEHIDEKNEDQRVRKISPGMRVQTHLSPIDDVNVAPWPGIYIYRFNNSFSWFSAKRLIFRIQVKEEDS